MATILGIWWAGSADAPPLFPRRLGCAPRDYEVLRLHAGTAAAAAHWPCGPQDLDPEQCLVLLREKGETVRWSPVCPALVARLLEHGQERHAPADGRLLRYADGRPITHRRYDHRR